MFELSRSVFSICFRELMEILTFYLLQQVIVYA